MRVVILAPIDNSPYALAVAERARREPGVELAGIVVRRILDLRRIRGELRRDGARLLRKVWRKLVVGAPAAALRQEAGFHELVEALGIPSPSLAGFARRHGIPYRRVADHNDPASVEFVRSLAPDLVPFTGGGLVRRPLLEAAGLGVLNAHMGILPAWRGMDVVEWPILLSRGSPPALGVTLHLMDPGVDTGPIVATTPIAIQPGDTMERLRRRYEPAMVELQIDGIRRARDGRMEPRAQRPGDGLQYFVLHPRLYEEARSALARLAAPPAGA